MENVNKIIKTISANKKANNFLFYLGLATTSYYCLKYLTKTISYLKKRANLNTALEKYKKTTTKPDQKKNWVTLINIDNEKNKILYYIDLISKKNLNLILILRDKTSEDQIFMKNLYNLTQNYKTKFRLIGYTNDEDYQTYFEQLEEEINDVESRFFILTNSEYNGINPLGQNSPVLCNEELKYIDSKIKLFTMSIVSFVKGNKDVRGGSKGLKVFMENFKCDKESIDYAMWDSFMFFTETVKNEIGDIEFKFISD